MFKNYEVYLSVQEINEDTNHSFNIKTIRKIPWVMSKIHKYRIECNNDNLSFENSGWNKSRTEKKCNKFIQQNFQKSYDTQNECAIILEPNENSISILSGHRKRILGQKYRPKSLTRVIEEIFPL